VFLRFAVVFYYFLIVFYYLWWIKLYILYIKFVDHQIYLFIVQNAPKRVFSWGLRRFPGPLVGWRRGYPLPLWPSPLDAFGPSTQYSWLCHRPESHSRFSPTEILVFGFEFWFFASRLSAKPSPADSHWLSRRKFHKPSPAKRPARSATGIPLNFKLKKAVSCRKIG